MKRLPTLSVILLAGAAIVACDGGGGSSPTTPAPTPPSNVTNPCASVTLDAPAEALAPPSEAEAGKREPAICLHEPRNVLGALWKHRASQARAGRSAADAAIASQDVGDISVIQDEGDIVIPANTFDLKGGGVSFVRNSAGGYDVRRGDATFRGTLGRRLTLGDDQSASVALPFTASFFGQSFATAFVNSDGNVTFEDADFASTERSVTRFLTGPPRIALYFADLDASAGGGIFVNAEADAFTVTWCNVPGFEESRKVTAQMVLQRDGQVDVKFADTTTLPDGIVGVSPGRTNVFTPVDLTATGGGAGGAGAAGEQFAESPDIDLAALGQKFYRTHTDAFDQLVVFSDQVLVTDAFAYEMTVANQIRGIGVDVFNASSEFGSAGRLSSIAYMDNLGKYPADPTVRFAGENSALGLIGHESGHRWLVSLRFRGLDGATSGAWLGRDDVHWSFFMDSDASFVEGNDIEDLGGGSFRTVAAVERYSALDQYAMGLRAAADVPPVFFVESPTNVPGDRTPSSNPRVGVAFNGTRRTVLIQDVQAALGDRQPPVGQAPTLHRQAFIYVISAGKALDQAAIAKLDRFRREWEPFFLGATGSRMRVETRLTP